MLDPRRLLLLAEVARHDSLTAAAGALGYSPSALSQQVAALEREAGAPVLERLARGVRLTEAGRALAVAGERVAAELAAARGALDALAGLDAGTLRVGAFASAWGWLLPGAVTTFRAAHPGVELQLARARAAGGPGRPARRRPRPRRRLRAARRARILTAWPPTLVALDPLRAVLPRAHALAGRRRVRLEELAGDPWVQPTSGCAAMVVEACAAAGFAPHTVFESDDYGAIQGFVAAGAGVALVPELALANRRDVVAVRVAPPAPARRLLAVRRQGAPPAAPALVERLREVARGRRPAVSRG